MISANDTFWFINRNHPIKTAHWNDSPEPEVIAYHSGTGDTHLITLEGAMILTILQEEKNKLNAEDITEKFRQSLNNPDLDFHSSDIIEAFLIPFQQLGFIEACPHDL